MQEKRPKHSISTEVDGGKTMELLHNSFGQSRDTVSSVNSGSTPYYLYDAGSIISLVVSLSFLTCEGGNVNEMR